MWFATPCFDLGPCEPGPCSSSRDYRAPAPFQAPSPSAPRISLSSRVLPENHRRAASTLPGGLWDSTTPLLGFSSLQRSRVKRVRLPRDFHVPARCVFRVRASLDALLPFAPSTHFWVGRSWDSPFRALLLPKIQRSLSSRSSPPGVARPNGTTLAMLAIGPIIVEVHDASRADR
jgi:hypothetical protein